MVLLIDCQYFNVVLVFKALLISLAIINFSAGYSKNLLVALKKLIFIFLLVCSVKAFAQNNPYAKVDSHAHAIWGLLTPIDTLALQLTAPYTSDSEKVRSIFYWVTHNISYDVVEYHKPTPLVLFPGGRDSAEYAAYYNEKYAEMVACKTPKSKGEDKDKNPS